MPLRARTLDAHALYTLFLCDFVLLISDLCFPLQQNNAADAAAAAAAAATMVGDPNGVVDLQSHAYAATAALSRRTPHKGANGHHLDTDSPMSGTGTPGMYNTHASSSYPILDDGNYQGQHLQAFGTPGDGSGQHDANGDGGPQTSDQLAATNSSLKTRVAELEVINDFITRRLGHYEPVYGSGTGQDGQDGGQQADETQLRSQIELLTQSERQLRADLEEGHRRENMMKRRLNELEQELKDTKDALGLYEGDRAKRPRLESSSSFSANAAADAAAAAAAATGSDAAPTTDGVTVAATAAAVAAAVTAAASTEADETHAAIADDETKADSAAGANGTSASDAEAASTALAALTAATADNTLESASVQDVAAAAAAVAAVASDAARNATEAAEAPSSPKP